MKKILLLALLALPMLAGAQILKTPGFPHYGQPPLDPPTKSGSEIAVDTTNRIWRWDRQDHTWRQLGYTVQQTVGCTAPVYTPDRTQSPIAIDGCSTPRLWFWNGSTWVLPPESVTSVNGSTGAVALDLALSGNTLSLTGDASTVNLSTYLDNTDGQTLDLTGNTLTISGGNNVSLSGYLDNTDAQNLSWNGVTGVIAISGGNSVDLDGRYLESEVDGSTTNELQNLSLTGQALGISSGSGVTLPIVGVSAGTGISVSTSSGVATVTNTGDTNAADDLTTSSTAGGDLSGTFSNLQIGSGTVGTAEIATDGVDAAEIAANAVGASELAATAVTPGSYTSANITVDADGRITAAANGSGGGGSDGNGIYTGSGNVPAATTATLYGTLAFNPHTGAGDIDFNVPTNFDGDAVFAGYTFFSGTTGFNGGIVATSVTNGGANGTSGIIFDVTEAAEHTDIKVNDVVRVSVTPDGSLSMPTTTGALVPPRLTTTERDATTPAEGWQIHNTDTHVPQYYDGSAWQNTARPYKVYVALITQSGSDAPTVIELENTTGATFEYSRTGDGSYRCDLSSGVMTENKTAIFFSGSNTGPTPAYYNARWVSDAQFRFETWDTATASVDGLLNNAAIEIRIYP